jgi:hypothetical protein
LSDDPEAAMAAAVRDDPEAREELEAAFREANREAAGLVETIRQFIETATWLESYRFVQNHSELLSEEAEALFGRLLEAAAASDDDNAIRVLNEHRGVLQRAREVGATAAFAEKMNAPPEALEAAAAAEELPPAVRELLAELAASGAEINSEEELQRLLAGRPDLRARLDAALADEPDGVEIPPSFAMISAGQQKQSNNIE